MAGEEGSYQALVDVYFKKEFGKEQNCARKYWICPASLTTEAILVSVKVAEEKDEGIAIRNIGLLILVERLDKLIARTKIELVRLHDREAEASDFTEKTFYGPI